MMVDLFERALAGINKGLDDARAKGVVVGPVIYLRVTKGAK